MTGNPGREISLLEAERLDGEGKKPSARRNIKWRR
jgi:hypothetical protein